MSAVKARPHGKPYHQQHPLLIQFILSELILAHHEVSKIAQVSHEFVVSNNTEALETLIKGATELSGSQLGYMRLLTWNEDGTLTKLKHYCSLLCQGENLNDKHCFQMHREANQTWLLSLHTLEVLKSLTHQRKPTNQNNDKLKNSLQRLQRSMTRLAALTTRKILQYRNDENVVFFVLRHWHSLDALYGKDYVRQLFNTMFTGGVSEAQQFLEDRYSTRGCDHLLPLINAKASELISS